MPILSKISSNSSIKLNALTDILSRDSFDTISFDVSQRYNILTRARKFDFYQYIGQSIRKFSTDDKIHSNTLRSMHEFYKECDGVDNTISNKCIHKYMCKDTSKEVVEIMTGLCLNFVSERIAKQMKRDLKKNNIHSLINQLTNYLNVDDIVFVDGTEVASSNGIIDNLGIKASGRKTSSGETAKPCIKLHIAYSLKKQCFDYVEVTGGTDSERDRVYFEQYTNTLFIMDAGYNSNNLEEAIKASGNFFIIKGKKNMAGDVKLSINQNGYIIQEHVNSKVSELPYNLNLDLDVEKTKATKNKKATYVRVLTKYNNMSKKTEDKRVILRTNLDRKLVSLEQIFDLYRLRWSIEIFNKFLKSSCALAPINSTMKNIIVFCVCISLISGLIKIYAAFCAALDKNKSIKFEDISLLKLKHVSNKVKELVLAFFQKGSSTIYQIFNELKECICKLCIRNEPSKRDADLLKDYHLIIKDILKLAPNKISA